MPGVRLYFIHYGSSWKQPGAISMQNTVLHVSMGNQIDELNWPSTMGFPVQEKDIVPIHISLKYVSWGGLGMKIGAGASHFKTTGDTSCIEKSFLSHILPGISRNELT